MRIVLLLLLGFMFVDHAFSAAGIVSDQFYKQLARVHQLMDDEQYAQALQRLQRIRTVKKRPYEQALLSQTFGYLYAAKAEYQKAIKAFKQCLTLQALSESTTQNILYALAQLQIAEADYPAAIASLELWFKQEKTPTPQAYALAGSAYAQAKRYTPAIDYLQQAISLAGEAPEKWYRQLLAIYYDAARYQAAANLLEEMIKHFPDRKTYWLQLSSIYRSLKDDAKSMAVIEMAFQQGLLSEERELLELANYYLYMETPHKAGKLLEQALLDGTVSTTGKHWKLLSDAWLAAREIQRSVKVLERAADLTQQASLYLRLAQLNAQIDDWSAVLQAVQKSLKIGGLKYPGKAYVLQGIAHYHRRDHHAARASFEHAKDDPTVQDQALQWLDYLTFAALDVVPDSAAN